MGHSYVVTLQSVGDAPPHEQGRYSSLERAQEAARDAVLDPYIKRAVITLVTEMHVETVERYDHERTD